MQAQDDETGQSELKIHELVKKAKFLSQEKPAADADLYIFFRSMLKCAACEAEIERCSKIYRKMNGKAEIIIMSTSNDEEALKSWIKKKKIKLPVLAPESKSLFTLTPYRHGGYPNIVIITPSGRELEITAGCPVCGDTINNWKKYLKESKKYERSRTVHSKKDKDSGDVSDENNETENGSETTVDETLPLKGRLTQVKYLTKKTPAKNARIYFFLRASSFNAESRDFMPTCISLYKKIKGRGAELIMLNEDKSVTDARNWAKESNIKFPIVSPDSVESLDIPAAGQLPSIIVLSVSGEELTRGDSAHSCEDILSKWDFYLKQTPK